MKSKTLVQSWLEVELVHNKRKLVDVLRELNQSMGTSHTHSRVREWQQNRKGRGDRLPTKLRLYMARKVIRSVLKASGISTKFHVKTLNTLVERLVA